MSDQARRRCAASREARRRFCADRSSPNAMPLFGAASAVVTADPEAYPIRENVHLTIRSRHPLPDVWREHGYDVSTAIIEVLVDARLLDDERRGESVREEIVPSMNGYSVSIERSRTRAFSIGRASPSPRELTSHALIRSVHR